MNFKEVFKTALNLVVICLCVGACLAFVNEMTKGRIKANEIKETMEARQKLIPADNYVDLLDPQAKAFSQDEIKALNKSGVTSLAKAVKDEKPAGYVVEAQKEGYSSKIKIMYGVSPAFELLGVIIKDSAETPGLGENIKKPDFTAQFKNLPLNEIQLTKDNGKIKAITGATISSRAVTDGVHNSLKAVVAELKAAGGKKPQAGMKKDETEPVMVNFNLFGAPVYACPDCNHKPDPRLTQLFPADKYVMIMKDVFRAIKGKKCIGFLVKASRKGYQDRIQVGYAVNQDLKILKVIVLQQNDTPGYGDKVEKEDYLKQYQGKTLKELVFKTEEAPGPKHVSAVTGATVSSQAVFTAVRESLKNLKAKPGIK